MFYIPPEIEEIIEILNENGYEAYPVGGCVRDMMTGTEPHDFDITTSAPPDVTLSLFPETVPTGIKHGTVTVISGGLATEVTTFRSDGEYHDCRRPDSVKFVKTLKEDLERRDFTVNAMAYSSTAGVIDFFGGKEDIKNGIMRAVGVPEQRFKEDALRILRLFRFSSVLGFEIEKNTLKAAIKCSPLLENISAERILTELMKTVTGKAPSAIRPLIDCGGLRFIGIEKFPDFEAVKMLSADAELAFFAFLYSAGADINKCLEFLKSSNKLKSFCGSMLLLLDFGFPVGKTEIKEQLYKTSPEEVKKFLLFYKAFFHNDISEAQSQLDDTIKNGEPYKISDLAVGGKDLISAGIKGKDIGKILEALRQLVADDPELNKPDCLMKKASELNRN